MWESAQVCDQTLTWPQAEIAFPLTHFHLESPTALCRCSNSIVCCAAVHPIITVLHAQDGQELPIPLDAVPCVEQPADTPQIVRTTGNRERELHLNMQTADATTNGNQLYL